MAVLHSGMTRSAANSTVCLFHVVQHYCRRWGGGKPTEQEEKNGENVIGTRLILMLFFPGAI
jgi:hypothetical protein